MFAITATLDWETSQGAGAGGTFQVVQLENDDGFDFTFLIDKGHHFANVDELRQAILRAIADRLTVDEA
jgi:type I restriction enzyme S subunit